MNYIDLKIFKQIYRARLYIYIYVYIYIYIYIHIFRHIAKYCKAVAQLIDSIKSFSNKGVSEKYSRFKKHELMKKLSN